MDIKQLLPKQIISVSLVIFLLFTQDCHALSQPKSQVVIMKDNYYSPKTITVSVGQTVTWVNKGKKDHTVNSSNGAFNSGHIRPGAKFSYTFTKPGTYNYKCTIHTLLGFGMTGGVIVKQ